VSLDRVRLHASAPVIDGADQAGAHGDERLTQSVIEQQEAANEELQSANEESHIGRRGPEYHEAIETSKEEMSPGNDEWRRQRSVANPQCRAGRRSKTMRTLLFQVPSWDSPQAHGFSRKKRAKAPMLST